MKYSKKIPNVFGVADDILIVHNDANGTDQIEHYRECYKYTEKKTLSLIKTNTFSGA